MARRDSVDLKTKAFETDQDWRGDGRRDRFENDDAYFLLT